MQNVGEWHLWAPRVVLGALKGGGEGTFEASTVSPWSPPSPMFDGFAAWGPVPLAPSGHWCLQPQWGSSKQADRSRLFPAPSLTTLPPSSEKNISTFSGCHLFIWLDLELAEMSFDG